MWYRYYRAEDSAAAVTLAIKPDAISRGLLGGQLYSVGISFCSPRDQFTKKLGRGIAGGRVSSSRARSTLLVSGTPGSPVGWQVAFEINRQLACEACGDLRHAAFDPAFPRWMRQYWLAPGGKLKRRSKCR